MEHIRRENLLFEAYLYRHKKDAAGDDEFEEKGKGKKKKVLSKSIYPCIPIYFLRTNNKSRSY